MTGETYEPKSAIKNKLHISRPNFTHKKQLEKFSLYPDQGGYDSHPGRGACNSPYGYLPIVNSGIPDCLPMGTMYIVLFRGQQS